MSQSLVRRSISALALVLALSVASWSQSTKPDVARMEQLVQADVAAKQFMGSVLVARGNDVILNKGYGSADLELNVANTPSTKFRLGSLTKQFTAASVLLLEERGKLSVTDPIKKYLPEAPAAWDGITLHHLLSHTSGIPDFTGFPDYRSTEGTAQTPEQLITRFRDRPLDFPTGDRFAYSNSNYIVLGKVIEKISGMPYAGFLQENIFTPLGMTSTGYDSNSAIIPLRARGYVAGPKGFVNASYIDMTIPFAAGGLYSTTEDLLKWEQALTTGRVISAASFAKMTTPVKVDYGYGLIIATGKDGHKIISHGGGIEGFNTYLMYFPDDQLTVAVLANMNSRAPQTLAARLAAVAHGETVVLASERKAIAVSAKVLSDYVGNYKTPNPNFSIAITLDGDQLMTQATGQGKLPLFAESESKFFLKVVDAQVEFFRDATGKVTHLVLYQNGRELKATRE